MTVNVEEKDTHFLYTCQVNGAQYRDYQQAFWQRALIFTVPVVSMASKMRRGEGGGGGGVEEGVREDHHSVVVVHEPRFVVLVDGRVVDVVGGFAEGGGLLYEWRVEGQQLKAAYRLHELGKGGRGKGGEEGGDGMGMGHIEGGLEVEGGGKGVLFRGQLEVNGKRVAPMQRPPLLPSAWKAERHEKVKEELEKKPVVHKAVEEQKEGGGQEGMDAINRRVSEVTLGVAGH